MKRWLLAGIVLSAAGVTLAALLARRAWPYYRPWPS